MLTADSNPGGGPAEKRDAEVALEMESIVSFHPQATRIGLAAAWIIDCAVGPHLSLYIGLLESLQNFQTEQRPILQGGVAVAAIAQLTAGFIQGRT